MSARVFPSSEAGQYTMRAAALRSLNTLPKKKKEKWAGSAGSFLSPAMANTIVTMDTEVKHKRQAYVIQMRYRQNSRALKTKQTPPLLKNYLHQLSSIAITYYKHIHHVNKKTKQKQNKIYVYSFQKCTLEHVSHTTKAGLHLLSYVGYELKEFREFLTYPLLDFHES